MGGKEIRNIIQGKHSSKNNCSLNYAGKGNKRLKKAAEILKSSKKYDRNNELKKYISSILISPEIIKIQLNNFAVSDSSADLSTRMGARRQSQDESRVVKKCRDDAPCNSLGNGEAQGVVIKNKPASDFSKAGSYPMVGSSRDFETNVLMGFPNSIHYN